MGNTTDIIDAAGLLWQVVRSNDLCLRHHECQETVLLLLTALLQLQKLSCRLPIPTSSQHTTKPSGDTNKDNLPNLFGQNQTERSAVESPPNTPMADSHTPTKFTEGEWARTLEYRDSVGADTHSRKFTEPMERSLNGI